jgi:hypothetical protein
MLCWRSEKSVPGASQRVACGVGGRLRARSGISEWDIGRRGVNLSVVWAKHLANL